MYRLKQQLRNERLAKLIRLTVWAWKSLLPPVITRGDIFLGPKPFAFFLGAYLASRSYAYPHTYAYACV